MNRLARLGSASLLWSILAGDCAGAAVGGSPEREAMADAMVRMMEAMGFMGPGSAAGPAAGMLPGAGGAGGTDALDRAGRWGREMMEGLGQALPANPARGALEGVWEAAGGGLLVVQGGAYRLYAPGGGYADGSLAPTGDRVRMWNRRTGFAAELEYALDQGRLALRDQSGQLYLYRRLVLPGGD